MAKRKVENEELVGMIELLETVELLVESAEPALKEKLTKVFDGYSRDFPDEYFWATGPKAPALLHQLMYSLMPNGGHVCDACAEKVPTPQPTSNKDTYRGKSVSPQ